MVHKEDGDMEKISHAEVAKHNRRVTNLVKAYKTTNFRAANSIIFQLGENILNEDPFNYALNEKLLKVYAVTH